MFFWMMLASLMGIVMFGTLRDKTRPAEDIALPSYESLALNMYQQHMFAVAGFQDAQKENKASTEAYIGTKTDGIVPLVTVTNNATQPGDAANFAYTFITRRIPSTYRAQNGTYSYMFCINKLAGQTAGVACSNTGAGVRYIVTYRAMPPRYSGSDKALVVRAIAAATGGSRFVGLYQKAETPLVQGSTTAHQPIGANYYVLSGGYAPAGSVYIPDYISCNAPLGVATTLGDKLKSETYMVAVSVLQGLEQNENMPAGSPLNCPALQ